MESNGKSLSGIFARCGDKMLITKEEWLEDRLEERRQWAEVMRLESSCDCYMCGEEIPEGTTSYPLQADGYGFVWGSDGCFPDGASAMYACFACRPHWNDFSGEDEEINEEEV